MKIFSRLFSNSKMDYTRENDEINLIKNSSFQEGKRYYLNVPYKEKETAKQQGAKWNPIRKQWYTHGYFFDNDDFAKWLDYEEEYSLFAPHFYIVESIRTCWKCEKGTLVFGLLYDKYEYLDDPGDPIRVSSKEIFINEWHKDYEPFFSALSDLHYETINKLSLINHSIVSHCVKLARRRNAQQYCTYCNSKQGNFYLFDEFDSPFSFIDPKVLNHMKLYQINIPIKSLSLPSYSSLENKKAFIRDKIIETIP